MANLPVNPFAFSQSLQGASPVLGSLINPAMNPQQSPVPQLPPKPQVSGWDAFMQKLESSPELQQALIQGGAAMLQPRESTGQALGRGLSVGTDTFNERTAVKDKKAADEEERRLKERQVAAGEDSNTVARERNATAAASDEATNEFRNKELGLRQKELARKAADDRPEVLRIAGAMMDADIAAGTLRAEDRAAKQNEYVRNAANLKDANPLKTKLDWTKMGAKALSDDFTGDLRASYIQEAQNLSQTLGYRVTPEEAYARAVSGNDPAIWGDGKPAMDEGLNASVSAFINKNASRITTLQQYKEMEDYLTTQLGAGQADAVKNHPDMIKLRERLSP